MALDSNNQMLLHMTLISSEQWRKEACGTCHLASMATVVLGSNL